jgi:hypothetical protein
MPATAKKKAVVEIDQVELIEQEIKTLQIKKKQAIADKIAGLEKQFLDSLRDTEVTYECYANAASTSYMLYVNVEKGSPADKLLAVHHGNNFRLSISNDIAARRSQNTGKLVLSSAKPSVIADFIRTYDVKPRIYKLNDDGHAQILKVIFDSWKSGPINQVDTK